MPLPLYPRNLPGIHCVGGWVRSRASLDGCGKFGLLSGFDPWTDQSVSSRYTDYAIPAHVKER